jgi:hypothetical protein
MHVQALGSERPVERFHIGIIGRLPWPREVDLHPVVIRPQIRVPTGELRSVVAEQQLRHSSASPDLIQNPDHISALQTLADFDGQTLAREHLQNGQGPEPPSANWSATKSRLQTSEDGQRRRNADVLPMTRMTVITPTQQRQRYRADIPIFLGSRLRSPRPRAPLCDLLVRTTPPATHARTRVGSRLRLVLLSQLTTIYSKGSFGSLCLLSRQRIR